MPAAFYLPNQYPFIIQRFKRLALLTSLLFISIPLACAKQYRVVAASDSDTLTLEPVQEEFWENKNPVEPWEWRKKQFVALQATTK